MKSGRPVKDLTAAGELLGHAFNNPDLLAEALTHPSADTGVSGARRDYQRLEFLGDRVLGLIVADRLLADYPDEDEGALARRFAVLVSGPTLIKVAGELGLGRYLRIGKGGPSAMADCEARVLADACEAVIGALYLDGGLGVARRFIEKEWRSLIAGHAIPPRDAKTALQEWTQARGLGLPEYMVSSSSGPPHAPRFEIVVSAEGFGSARSSGGSKREAERSAAEKLLERLEADEANGR